MMSHPSDSQLRELLDADCTSTELATWTTHVGDCPECQIKLETLAADRSLWNRFGTLVMAAGDPPSSELPPLAPSALDFPSAKFVDLDGSAPKPTFASVLPTTDPDSAPSQFLDPPAHPELLGRIAHYEVESLIGRGGMGVVFKAFDTQLHRSVAIKFLSPHLSQSGPARQRFARESKAVAAVLHPNVIPIHGVHSHRGTPYIVMPYVSGPSLQQWVDRSGALSELEVVRIGMQIAAGLSAAHSQGIVHRDIKPANVLIESNGSRASLTDFGLARALDDASMTQSGCLLGTPEYMSPEQAAGKSAGVASDLFSLGSVLYFAATGHPPFRAESAVRVLQQITDETPRPVVTSNQRISMATGRIIHRLLSKSPGDRPGSASEVHALFQDHLSYLQKPDPRESPSSLRGNSPFPKIAPATAVGGGLALVGGLVIALAASAFVSRSESHGAVNGRDPLNTPPASVQEKKTTRPPHGDFAARWATAIAEAERKFHRFVGALNGHSSDSASEPPTPPKAPTAPPPPAPSTD